MGGLCRDAAEFRKNRTPFRKQENMENLVRKKRIFRVFGAPMLTLQKTEGQATCSLSTLAPEASLNEGERKNRQQKNLKKFNKK